MGGGHEWVELGKCIVAWSRNFPNWPITLLPSWLGENRIVMYRAIQRIISSPIRIISSPRRYDAIFIAYCNVLKARKY